MKWKFYILLFLFNSILDEMTAQIEFMDFQYQWTEYYISSGIQGTYHFSESNTFDSTAIEINGKIYHERLTSNLPTGDDWNHTQMYYRADDTGKVYVSYFGFETQVLDYSLNVNDTIFGTLVVIAVDSIELLNGEKRKQLTLKCTFDDDPPTGFGYKYWIEGLGSTHGLYSAYYSPFEECAFDADGYITLCISRNDTLLYDNPEYDSCWYLPVATKEPNFENITISPNPASTAISIDETDHVIQKVSIIDLFGNIIFKGNELIVDISFLPAGYYFIQILFENEQVVMKRFVKI
jgi:hypothetical protein